jgi:hypothetical protein
MLKGGRSAWSAVLAVVALGILALASWMYARSGFGRWQESRAARWLSTWTSMFFGTRRGLCGKEETSTTIPGA